MKTIHWLMLSRARPKAYQLVFASILTALMAGLALSGCATTQGDYKNALPTLSKRDFAPLPPSLPPKVAAFQGVWEGAWDGILPSRLIISEINSDWGEMFGEYIWANHPLGYFKGGSVPIIGTFSFDGKMGWSVPGRYRGYVVTFTFTISDDLKSIKGVRHGGGNDWAVITMSKVQ